MAYAFCVGRMTPHLIMGREMRKGLEKALDMIKHQEGFIGIYPKDLWHNILVYRTLNDAKRAKNELRCEGVETGNYVIPVLVPKAYTEGGD